MILEVNNLGQMTRWAIHHIRRSTSNGLSENETDTYRLRGRTFANGPNWIDQLTVQYNQSYIETLNFAIGGAILDRSAIGPYDYRLYDGGASPSVQDEILSTFIPSYGDSPARFKWTSESTLFTTFVGINDVSMVWWAPNRTAIYDESFRTYSEVLDTLYQTGARNFLALNVPPFYRSPGSKGANWTAAQYDHYDQGIREWNDRLIKTITNLTTVYADVRAGVIDTYTLFDAAQNYPCSNALTCPIRAPDEYCWPSDPVDIGQYGRDEGCRWFADQYFWRDAWHPSWRVHEMLADAIARLLWRLDD